jgi:phosphoribosylformylglycinamidine synthase PurS subunit
MDFEVLVKLKDEVLDPEGRAITETLRAHGVSGIDSKTSIEVSKRYVVSISLEESQAEEAIKKIAENYLANPVSQTYEIRRIRS